MMPFYSLGHFAFAVVFVGGIYLIMLRFDPAVAVGVTLGSFAGIAAAGSFSRPSWMLISPGEAGEVESLLKEHGYDRQRSGEWVRPLPIWLKWRSNKIEMRRGNEGVLVAGPATVLRDLAAELSSKS